MKHIVSKRIRELSAQICGWEISINPAIEIEHVLEFIDLNWDWNGLSMHPNMKFDEHILGHPELPWQWVYVSRNPNVAMCDVESHSELQWNWDNLSINPSIKPIDIIRNIELPWNWYLLGRNRSIDIDFLARFSDEPKLNWKDISQWANISYEDVVKHLKLPWEWNYLALNRNINWKDVHDYLNNSYYVALNPQLTIEDIISHPEIPWKNNYIYFAKNPNIPVKYFEDLRDVCERDKYLYISMNPNVTKEHVLKYFKTGLLDMQCICKQPNISYQDIVDHPEIRWSMYSMSCNPRLFDPTLKEMKEYFAGKKICRQIFESYTNPEYLVCQRRLTKEFYKLSYVTENPQGLTVSLVSMKVS